MDIVSRFTNYTKDLERLLNKVDFADNGCWEWTAALNAKGYGYFSFQSKCRLAHRVSYYLIKGDLDPSLELDHLCRNAKCVNPWHLEQVTRKENQHRGETISRHNLDKTSCPMGHLYSSENTHIDPVSGGRRCRECGRIRSRTGRPAGRPKPTHCNRGHEFSPENTYLAKGNHRHCRQCQRIRDKDYRNNKRTSTSKPDSEECHLSGRGFDR